MSSTKCKVCHVDIGSFYKKNDDESDNILNLSLPNIIKDTFFRCDFCRQFFTCYNCKKYLKEHVFLCSKLPSNKKINIKYPDTFLNEADRDLVLSWVILPDALGGSISNITEVGYLNFNGSLTFFQKLDNNMHIIHHLNQFKFIKLL